MGHDAQQDLWSDILARDARAHGNERALLALLRERHPVLDRVL